MTLGRAPQPFNRNDIGIPEDQFKNRVVEMLNWLRDAALQNLPDAGGAERTSSVRGSNQPSGGTSASAGNSAASTTIRLPNSLGLMPGELVSYAQGTVNRASQTGNPCTHIVSFLDGSIAVLVSSSPSVKVILDGSGSGPYVYLGSIGKATLERPTPSVDGDVWEQIIGTRIDNVGSGLVTISANIPASVPIRV